MDSHIQARFDGLAPMISNTPLLKISFLYKGEARVLFAKAEYYNLTGSIKDRVAYHMLKKAYQKGEIKCGDIIAEATSGNTGIAFSAIGTYLGHKVKIFMPDWMSRERISLMQSYGAEVKLVSREQGGFLGSIDMTEKLFEQGGVYLPRQFSNEDNTEAHYADTGAEIIRQLKKLGLSADGVVAGVDTGGTIMGLKNRLREENPSCKAYPLEPASSPTLSTGYKVGTHKIQGISDEFIPSIVKLKELDEVVSVEDGDAILMARQLSEKLGIGVGVSSGANFVGGVMAQEKLGRGATVVTVFADDNKKYLSTDYALNPETLTPNWVKDIELTGVTAYR